MVFTYVIDKMRSIYENFDEIQDNMPGNNGDEVGDDFKNNQNSIKYTEGINWWSSWVVKSNKWLMHYMIIGSIWFEIKYLHKNLHSC